MNNELMSQVFAHHDAGICVLDEQHRVIMWNEWLARLSGISGSDALLVGLEELLPELRSGRLLKAVVMALENGMASRLSHHLHPHPLPLFGNVRNRSKRLHQSITVKAMQSTGGGRLALLQVTDVSAVVVREQELKARAQEMADLAHTIEERDEHVRTVFQHTREGLITAGEDGRIVDINPAATAIFGYRREQLLGRPMDCLMAEPTQQRLVDAKPAGFMMTITNSPASLPKEFQGQRANGEIFPMEVSSSRVSAAGQQLLIGSIRDITERRKSELRIHHLAHHDALTGLPNRMLFQDRLDRTLAEARRREVIAAVMFLDLDRFKTINDTLGHHTGDALLESVALRLQSLIRESDTVARLGGDEFAIIQTGLDSVDGATTLAEKVIAELSRPFNINGQRIHTSTSIGISLYPNDEAQPDQMLRGADLAMYRAKKLGRNQFQFFSADMQKEVQNLVQIEQELRLAIEAEQFVLHYQPQVSLSSDGVIGVEALVRWEHPERGRVPPGDFIPIAEDSGLILPLGRWVIHEACRQSRRWRDIGLHMRVAVNLSAVQFSDPQLISTVSDALKTAGLDASYLELEITESFLMKNPEVTAQTLNQLHALGVELSIDDFGTGYSSLSYLKRFPVHKIKIDRSFVADIGRDKDDTVITLAVINLGHSLGKKVIAEGLESVEQLEFLRMHDCDEVQGFYFSRPLPADEFMDYMEKGRSKSA